MRCLKILTVICLMACLSCAARTAEQKYAQGPIKTDHFTVRLPDGWRMMTAQELNSYAGKAEIAYEYGFVNVRSSSYEAGIPYILVNMEDTPIHKETLFRLLKNKDFQEYLNIFTGTPYSFVFEKISYDKERNSIVGISTFIHPETGEKVKYNMTAFLADYNYIAFYAFNFPELENFEQEIKSIIGSVRLK